MLGSSAEICNNGRHHDVPIDLVMTVNRCSRSNPIWPFSQPDRFDGPTLFPITYSRVRDMNRPLLDLLIETARERLQRLRVEEENRERHESLIAIQDPPGGSDWSRQQGVVSQPDVPDAGGTWPSPGATRCAIPPGRPQLQPRSAQRAPWPWTISRGNSRVRIAWLSPCVLAVPRPGTFARRRGLLLFQRQHPTDDHAKVQVGNTCIADCTPSEYLIGCWRRNRPPGERELPGRGTS